MMSWKNENNTEINWKIKYYKGLGTSNRKEAQEYFKNLKTITYLKMKIQIIQLLKHLVKIKQIS